MFRTLMIGTLAAGTALASATSADAARFTHVGPHGYTHWAGGWNHGGWHGGYWGGYRGGYWGGGYWHPGAAVAAGAVAGTAVGAAAAGCSAYHPYYPYAYCGPY